MPEETEVNIKTHIAQIMGTLLLTGSTNKTRFQTFTGVGGHFALILRSSEMILTVLFTVECTDCVIILINAYDIPFV